MNQCLLLHLVSGSRGHNISLDTDETKHRLKKHLELFLKAVSVHSGVAESPLMTWGEIESTPFRLDGSDTPYVERNHGPSFKALNL